MYIPAFLFTLQAERLCVASSPRPTMRRSEAPRPVRRSWLRALLTDLLDRVLAWAFMPGVA